MRKLIFLMLAITDAITLFLVTEFCWVWSTDITYIRLQKGFVYLVAIIDWYSRYVLNWRISTTLEADFCIETLEETLAQGHCEIFNTDQCSQFTTNRFTDLILYVTNQAGCLLWVAIIFCQNNYA